MPVDQPPLAAPYPRLAPRDNESMRERSGDSLTKKKSWVDDLDPRLKKFGLVAMLASSLCFAIMALMVKLLAKFSTFELVFWRSLFMTVFSTGMCLRQGNNPFGTEQQGILIARGVAGFFFMAAFYAAIKSLPLSDAVVITYLSPVLTSIAAFVLLGEAFGKLDVFGSCLSLTGVVLVSKPTFIMSFFGEQVEPLPMIGTLWAFGAAFSSTCVYLLLRLGKSLLPMVATNYFAMCGTLLGPIFSYLFGEVFHMPEGLDFVWLILLAVLSVLGQNLMNIGIALESVGKATAMNYTQVAWSYIFQIFILHNNQGSDWQSVVGASMIASWGAVTVMKEMRDKDTSETKVQPEDNDKTKSLLAAK